MSKQIDLKILGTHCRSCKTLIEGELLKINGISKASVDFATGESTVEYDDKRISPETIITTVKKLNYQTEVSDAHSKKPLNPTGYIFAGILAIMIAYGYYFIRQLGLLDNLAELNEKSLSYGLLFFIGILVSFHCIGMCGGLVVAYAARQGARDSSGKKIFSPHFFYNFGRVISYTVIGGILGGIGSFFGINPTFQGVITLAAAVFMLLMGLSLITNFRWLKKFQIKTPAFIAKIIFTNNSAQKPKGPFIIGLLNGFMPCGPLQAAQLYALGTGSFARGSLSMAAFSLGTIPVMLSFGSIISLISKDHIKKVMKLSGAIIIILGLLMINRGLINFGINVSGDIPQSQISQISNVNGDNNQEYQEVKMDLTYRGYEPNVLYIKNNLPVRWVINVKQMSGCTDEIIMQDYNISKKLVIGENIVEFTPKKEGELRFSCWMKMVWGKFIVTEGNEKGVINSAGNSQDLSQDATCSLGGGCGTSEKSSSGCGDGCRCGNN